MTFLVRVVGCLWLLLPMGALRAVDLIGEHENPNAKFGKAVNYRLTGDAKFGWRTDAIAGDIDLNGHAFVMDTGNGNRTVFSGAITGRGRFEWCSGEVPQVAPSILTGRQPNSLQGTFVLSKGVLNLNKPAGTDAISCDLEIGTKASAVVKLDQANQINDAAHVKFAGDDYCELDLQGHNERFASLTLRTHAVISFGEPRAALVVGDCQPRNWDLTKTLTIRQFKIGQDKLVCGGDAPGLSAAQLARVGFASPRGLPNGLYTAKFGPNGELVPDQRVQAISPPFDVSDAAIAARTPLFSVAGLKKIGGPQSPLRAGTVIAFFGDSITWQNGFIGTIAQTLAAEPATKDKNITLINRGINGGGVLQLRDGAKEGGFPGNSPQRPFAELLAADRADIAVVFIGINDVWWRNTTPEDFERGLRDLAAAAEARRVKLVLATMTVHGELPDGKNGDDAKIEQYAELTRKVATHARATLVDLRRSYIAFLQNHNAQLRVDGSLFSTSANVLTYDGVHPNATGVKLLANLISDGIVRACESATEKK